MAHRIIIFLSAATLLAACALGVPFIPVNAFNKADENLTHYQILSATLLSAWPSVPQICRRRR